MKTLSKTLSLSLLSTLLLANCAMEGGNEKNKKEVTGSQSQLIWSAVSFSEDTASNNGSFSVPITLNLQGDAFVSGLSSLVQDQHYSLSGGALPGGLSLLVSVESQSLLKLSLQGQAAAHDVGDSLAGLWFEFLPSAFASGLVPEAHKKSLAVVFVPPANFGAITISYSGNPIFVEIDPNSGQLPSSLLATLGGGASFAISSGTLSSPAHYFISAGVPTGLSVQVSVQSATTASISFVGTAANHHSSASVSGLMLSFKPEAFVPQELPANGSGTTLLSIQFQDSTPAAASLSFVGAVFSESATQPGTIDNSAPLKILATGTEFVSPIGGLLLENDHYQISSGNIPFGLSLELQSFSATELRLALTGTATHHGSAVGADFDLTLLPAAFTGALPSNPTKTYTIDFKDFVLTFSSTVFKEASANNGSIGNEITVTAVYGLFAGSSFPLVLSQGTHYNITGTVPAGLSFVVELTSATTAKLKLSGLAQHHKNIHDTAFTLKFLGMAFDFDAGLPLDQSKLLSVDFDDPVAPPNAVFVYAATAGSTLQNFTGNLGGTKAAADAKCQSFVPSAYGTMLQNMSKLALISIGTFPVANIPSHYGFSNQRPIHSLASDKLANNWSELLDGDIDLSLAYAGVLPANTFWWSGSRDDGTSTHPVNCNDFSSASSADYGFMGGSEDLDIWWIFHHSDACHIPRALLCLAFAP